MGAMAPPIVGLKGSLHKKRAMLGAGRPEVKRGHPNQPVTASKIADFLLLYSAASPGGRFPQLRKNLRKTPAETGVRP